MDEPMKRLRCGMALVFALLTAATAFPGDERSLPVDFVFLVDRSLSMKPVLEDVKRYLAADVIGPLVLPGDSVTLLAFYGKVERIWQGKIGGEADKAALVRSLHKLIPNGRYTDIGHALDELDPILKELDAKDRVKYILLLTDERQEAPPGSPYGSKDYSITHPYLTYINRKDLGTFRAITIGMGLNDRIASTAESLASFLQNPPDRSDSPLPGTQEGTNGGIGPQKGAAGAAGPSATSTANGGTLEGKQGLESILAIGIGVAAVAVVVFGILLVRSRKRKDDSKEKSGGDQA
jgi:hypothetical protein